jgi:predicted PurR-regulated permease PerM
VSRWGLSWLNARRIAAVVALGLTFWVIRSFIVPLIWAAIFAIANWPIYRRSAQYLPDALRMHVLPLAFSILITFVVLGPIIFAFGVLAGESQTWLTELSIMDKTGFGAPSWLGAIPMVGMRIADAWNDALGTPGGLSALLGRLEGGSLLLSLQSVGHLIVYHAFVVSVTIVTLVLLLRQGETLAELLARRVDEQFGRPGAEFVGVAIAALRATVQSMVFVGFIDGIALGIIYSAANIPSPVAWAAVTGIFAMLPFIGYFAVAAVCAAQITHDASASALVVATVGCTVLFLSDKFARPMLMAKGARLDFLGALMGTVGGLQSFGLLGIFVGPVIVAVGKAIFDEWLTHASPASLNTADASVANAPPHRGDMVAGL